MFMEMPVVSIKEVANPEFDITEARKAQAEGRQYDQPQKIAATQPPFMMDLRPEHISGFNPVTDAPEGSGITLTVYMARDSGLPQLYTTWTREELLANIAEFEDEYDGLVTF